MPTFPLNISEIKKSNDYLFVSIQIFFDKSNKNQMITYLSLFIFFLTFDKKKRN